MDERSALARHEAGHALVFLELLKSRDFTASIQPTAAEAAEGFAGIVRDGRPGAAKPLAPIDLADLWEGGREQLAEVMRPNLRRRAINCYAGVAAQFPHSAALSIEMAHHSKIDLRNLREWAEGCGFGLEVHQRDFEHFGWACEFLDPRWGQVLAIARALEEAGELSGARCAELAESAPDVVNMRTPWIAADEGAGGNARGSHQLSAAGDFSFTPAGADLRR